MDRPEFSLPLYSLEMITHEKIGEIINLNVHLAITDNLIFCVKKETSLLKFIVMIINFNLPMTSSVNSLG